MSEFYIRREGDEEAIGPYNIDQLSSLIDAKKLDSKAFYYNMDTEEWDKLSSNEELMATLYPVKRKLSLRTDKGAPPVPEAADTPEDIESNQAEDDQETPLVNGEDPQSPTEEPEQEVTTPISGNTKPSSTQKQTSAKKNMSVADMLAAAEGRHLADTQGKTPTEVKAKAAFLCLQLCTLFFFLSAASMVYIDIDTILKADAIKIAKSPFIITALIDLLIGLFLALQVTSLYPLIRFRAAIGIGFYTLFFYSIGQPFLLLGNIFLMVAIYFATAIIDLKKAYIALGLGLAGIAAYAYALVMPMFG